jgi:hypothetical protein
MAKRIRPMVSVDVLSYTMMEDGMVAVMKQPWQK